MSRFTNRRAKVPPEVASLGEAWTMAHQGQALMWLWANLDRDALPLTLTIDDIATEEAFRGCVVRSVDMMAEEAAVRRVRALAEGRLVRETFYGVRVDGQVYRQPNRETARRDAASLGVGVVRVTRIGRPR